MGKKFNNQQSETIHKLTIELIDTAKKLDDLENLLITKLDEEDEEAHQILDESMEKAEVIYKVIGSKLNDIGGFELMQTIFYAVPNDGGGQEVISSVWNGIGEWMY